MSDKDKKFDIDADPELKKALQDLAVSFDQAAEALERGEYETFEDAVEAITGGRPKKLTKQEVETLIGEGLQDDDDDPIIFADGGIRIGLCGNPACTSVHYGLMDSDGTVFADGKLKLEDVPKFIRELDALAETLKQKANPQ